MNLDITSVALNISFFSFLLSQTGESPDELIKFGQESIDLDSWVRRRQYSALREVLGSGTNTHLKENSLLREIFGLGAPLVITPGTSNQITKFEKVSSFP